MAYETGHELVTVVLTHDRDARVAQRKPRRGIEDFDVDGVIAAMRHDGRADHDGCRPDTRERHARRRAERNRNDAMGSGPGATHDDNTLLSRLWSPK
jgi:hypothetical protein